MSGKRGSDGASATPQSSNSIPKGVIPKLAKDDLHTFDRATSDGQAQIRQQDAARAKAAREGWN